MTIVPGCGPRDANIMCVGEAPAKNEERLGYPFAGKAGDEFNSLLGAVNLARGDIYITNASLERVTVRKKEEHFFKYGQPTEVFVRGIAQLYKDIQEIKPNVVVAMGNYAHWALRQVEEIMHYRGSVLWADLPSVKVVPTLHPASLFYGEDNYSGWRYRPIIILDLLRAKQEASYPDMRLKPRKSTIIESLDTPEADYAIERLRKAEHIILDIETFGGLDLACIGMGDGDPSWAACFVYNNNPRMMALYRELLDNDIPKVGQNLMYDCTALDQLDCYVRNVVYDTMVAQHLLMTDLPKSLEFMTSIYSDIGYYKEDRKTWKKSAVGIQQLWEYNCKDIFATTDSWIEQQKDLAEDRYHKQTFDRVMQTFEPYRQTTKDGWLIDHPLLMKFIEETETKAVGFQQALDELAGHEVNPRSSKQVKELLYEERGITPRTRNKKVTVKEEVLMDIAAKSDDPIPHLIVLCRRSLKLLSNYYNENILSSDGRARSTVNIVGTKTGRVSMGIPLWGPGDARQTIPYAARELYIADGLEYEIGTFDLAQAEAVIVAYLAQDPLHMECFQKNWDVHRVTACIALDRPLDEWPDIPKDGVERKLYKEANHAMNYNLGPESFMYRVNKRWDPMDPTSLKITRKKADEIHARWHAARPAVRGYWDWVRGELKRNNMTLINPLGRKREFLDKWSDTLFKDAYAWIPQGTVGDVTCIGMLRILADEELTEAGVVLRTQTHDSTSWQWPIANRDFIVPRMMKHLEVMLSINGYNIIIPVDGGCGPNWLASCTGYIDLGKSRTNVEV